MQMLKVGVNKYVYFVYKYVYFVYSRNEHCFATILAILSTLLRHGWLEKLAKKPLFRVVTSEVEPEISGSL